MDRSSLLTVYGSLLLAGLAGSLHCIGMCGPILAGFSTVFSRATLTVEGAAMKNPRRFPLLGDFAFYHVGRIWTYAILGFVAGLTGQGLRHSSTYLGWQKPVSIAICAAVIAGGLILLGVIPGIKMDGLLTDCGASRWSGKRWLSALLNAKGPMPRLLLGAVMGLLPCGLVYAMLLMVAALPTPWHAALGMIAFGLGTLPSLTAVLATAHLLPTAWRRYGTQLAAVVIILTGGWMLTRTLLAHAPATESEQVHCLFCSPEATPPRGQ